MTESEASPPPSLPEDGPRRTPTVPPLDAPTRAGEPAPPGSSEGRAHSFRERETQRRSRRRELIGQLLVVAIILLGIYAIVSARPFVPSSGPGPAPPAPSITVNLTKPVVGNVTCGNGGTAYTERVVWSNSTVALTTKQVSPRVYELFDQDIIPDDGVTANVSSTSVCAGDPPSGGGLYSWYVVLMAPNGTIELGYTFDQGWVSADRGPVDLPIPNGSSLVVVVDPEIAGQGYGLAISVDGVTARGAVPL